MKKKLTIVLEWINAFFIIFTTVKNNFIIKIQNFEYGTLCGNIHAAATGIKLSYIIVALCLMSVNFAQAQNITVSNGETLTISENTTYSSLTVNNGGKLIVQAPATLTVGTIGNSATNQVVDFQNGSNVNVNSGAFMVVYGLLNNSNNSDNVTINGDVYVDGNYQGGQKSAIIGTGTFNSSGKMATDGSNTNNNGLIFNSPTDCNSGPCSGNNLSCSMANTITTSNQSICQGTAAATFAGSAVASATYQWQSSTDGSSFSNISGATNKDYSPGSITTTTYYLRIATTTCSNKSSQRVVIVTSGVPTGTASITGSAAACENSSYTYSVSGITKATGYTWTVPSDATITAGAGTSSITVTMGAASGTVSVVPYNICGNATGAAIGSKTVTVTLANAATIAYPSATYCKNTTTTQTPTITGTTGGTFSKSSGTLTSFSTTTGSFVPSSSSISTFTITYTMAATGACPAAAATTSFTIVNTNINATGAISGTTPVCQNKAGGVYSIAAVTNATNYTWTVPTGATITSGSNTNSITVTMGDVSGNFTVTPATATCTGATSTLAVTVSSCANTWTGTSGTAWNTAGNWSLGTVPTSQNDVVIPNVTNKPIIAAGVTAITAKVTINALSSLTINSTGALNASGSITNNGTFTANSGSTVALLGTSAQTISGVSTLYNTTVNNSAGVTLVTALTLKGKLSLTKGNLTSSGNLSIDIDNGGNIGYATGDAGTVSGNVTVYRAINSSTTHYISSPLDGVTANDLADDAQVINPATNKTRLFQFDNTAYAWSAVSSLSTVMSPSSSFSMWFPAATTVDFTGSYNHAATYSYSAPNVASKFMFVSNPYPSALDWDAASGWSKSGVNNAIYFWNPTTNSYSSYVGGSGTNGGTKYIPAMNSFFVAYNGTTPSTATLAMDGRVRTSTYAAMWRTAAEETVRVTLKSSSASDETVIRFNEEATNDFDGNLDAFKMMNASTVPSIYTMFGTTKYSINSIADPEAKDTIALFTKIPADGDYVLSIKSSDPGIEYILVDKKLGTEMVVSTIEYAFTALKADDINRFDLQLRQTGTAGVQDAAETSDITILSSPNGFLIKSSITGTCTIDILDVAGNKVHVLQNMSISNGNNFFTPEIAEGVYLIKMNMGNKSYMNHVSIIKR